MNELQEIKQEITRLVDIATSEKTDKFEDYKKQKLLIFGLIEREISSAYYKGKSDAAVELSGL